MGWRVTNIGVERLSLFVCWEFVRLKYYPLSCVESLFCFMSVRGSLGVLGIWDCEWMLWEVLFMFVFVIFVSVVCVSMWVCESDYNPYGECLWAGLVKIYVKQPIQELIDEG